MAISVHSSFLTYCRWCCDKENQKSRHVVQTVTSALHHKESRAVRFVAMTPSLALEAKVGRRFIIGRKTKVNQTCPVTFLGSDTFMLTEGVYKSPYECEWWLWWR